MGVKLHPEKDFDEVSCYFSADLSLNASLGPALQ